MKTMAYQRKNNENIAIEFDFDNRPEVTNTCSFISYAKAGLAIASTLGTVALIKTAGFLPSFGWSNDVAPTNPKIDNSYQPIHPQETITFTDNSLPIQPKHAKRAFGGEFQINTYTSLYQRHPSVIALD